MLISFENADGTVFDIRGNYLLSPNWSGFGELPVEHQSTRAPYQDGDTYIDTVGLAREMTVEFIIMGSNRQQVFDRRLIVTKHFNPMKGIGTLIWEQEDGTIYHIDCIPRRVTFPSGDGQGRGYQVVIVEFYAPNPFWYDPTQIEQVMVGFSGGLQFDWSFPISFGQVGSQVTLENAGDVDSPIMVYFYGEVVNPTITNETTGESIIIERTVNDGDILIVSTAFGEKAVQVLSGGEYVNAFEYVNPDSEFWSLKPGKNIVSYSVASEGENAQCRLYYYNRYSGV
jgi:hypothetical protein